MTCVLIPNVIVRNRLILLQDTLNSKTGFKKMKKVVDGTEKTWKIFIKFGLKITTPSFPAGMVAKTKNL